MKSNRKEGGSRTGNVDMGGYAGDESVARLGKCDADSEENRLPGDSAVEAGGGDVVAGVPGVGEGGGVVFRMDGKPGVLEVFRRSVPERELKRRQRLPRVVAFGDFLRLLGMFSGDGCVFRPERECRQGGLNAFRELEKLAALCASETVDGELIFPIGTVCLRRKIGKQGRGNAVACGEFVIDLSDLFK